LRTCILIRDTSNLILIKLLNLDKGSGIDHPRKLKILISCDTVDTRYLDIG